MVCYGYWFMQVKTAAKRGRDMEPTDIKRLMAGMRFEPRTKRQWEAAEAGAAACDRYWNAKALRPSFAGGPPGADRYYRAGYELRYHEVIAANAGWLHGREPYPGDEAVMVRAG